MSAAQADALESRLDIARLVADGAAGAELATFEFPPRANNI
jgi:hypothetical protein